MARGARQLGLGQRALTDMDVSYEPTWTYSRRPSVEAPPAQAALHRSPQWHPIHASYTPSA